MTTRYRVRTASTSTEAEFQQALKDAQEGLTRAQSLCARIRREGGRTSPDGRRAHQYARRIGQALTILRDVGRITPRTDSDPDLLPEDVRVQRFRERLEAQRRALKDEAAGRLPGGYEEHED